MTDKVDQLRELVHALDTKVAVVIEQNKGQNRMLGDLQDTLDKVQVACDDRHCALNEDMGELREWKSKQNGIQHQQDSTRRSRVAEIAMTASICGAVFAGLQWLLMR